MKKTIMVSNSWRPEKGANCGKCGAEIDYSWGDYTFRYFELKDKSDLCVICKSCAAQMKNNDKKIRVINRAPFMDLINLKNSGWKSQPKRKLPGMSGFGFNVGGQDGDGAEVNPADEKDTDK